MAHIDTLQVYKELVTSGVPIEQAEAHVHALNASFDSVATKDDLSRLANDTKEWINNLEYRLEAKIDSKTTTLMTIGGAMFGVQILTQIETLQKNGPAMFGAMIVVISGAIFVYWLINKPNKTK